MTKQMMFYEKVVPVSQSRHALWSVAPDPRGFAFAADSTAAPLMTAEFLSAVTEYPIVFGRGTAGCVPMVVLGVQNGQSLFVGDDGNWQAGYIPAFVRRYPFVFAPTGDGQTMTLCLDETYGGCDPDGREGERLYGDDGQPTDYLQKVMEFSRSYEVEQRRTREFCRLIEERGLLDEMQASVNLPDGAKRLTGFQVVSRERLKQLDGEALEDFFRRDLLELVYYHLASLKNLEKLRHRAAGA